MIVAIIKAPNKDYTGISAGVSFVKGEGKTDDKWKIEWFKRKGYEIVEVDPPVDEELESLKEKAKQLNIKGYSNMKKETLLKKIEEAEQNPGNDQQEGYEHSDSLDGSEGDN